MDIKSLIDTEDAAAASNPLGPPVPKQASGGSCDGAFNSCTGKMSEIGFQRDSRPPQLSSLHTPGHQDSRYLQRSPYGSAFSPSQQPHFDIRQVARYPSPQQHARSPPNSYHPAQFFPQDSRSSFGTPTHLNPGSSTPITVTPTGSTPGSAGAYSSWQRPSSSHSASTPTSTQQAPQYFARESSQALNGHNGPLSHPMSVHQVSPQSSAPLGPPSTRPKPMDSRRESPGSGTHQRSFSGGLHDPQKLSEHSHSVFRSSSVNEPSTPRSRVPYERERSVSVSPKTRSMSFPPPEPVAQAQAYNNSCNGQNPSQELKEEHSATESVRVEQEYVSLKPQRSTSLGIQCLLNEEPQRGPASRSGNQVSHNSEADLSERSPQGGMLSSGHSIKRHNSQLMSASGRSITTSDQYPNSPRNMTTHQSSSKHRRSTPPSSHHNSMPEIDRTLNPRMPSGIAQQKPIVSATKEPPSPQAQSESHMIGISPPSNVSFTTNQAATLGSVPTVPSQPAKKKPRLNSRKTSQLMEGDKFVPPPDPSDSAPQSKKKKPPRLPIPIFAQSVRNCDPSHISSNSRQQAGQGGNADPVRQQQGKGHPSTNGVSIPAPQPSLPEKGPLGHWEPSILNVIPTDEVVRIVSDFLFTQVLVNETIGVAPAGSSAGRGAVLEIEAKIGRIIDKNTMDRLQLPVLTETVLNRDHPNMRTNFESSMTETQHRALNGFLNKALIATQAAKPTPQNPNPPPNDRVRMDYKHTKETDTFYDLSQTGILALPQAITSATNHPRLGGKTKVRITRDQKTGKELAKIVKARIADVDVYSPQNQADWRISVNVEMDFKGDMRDLVEADKKDGKRTDRNKDRMSYKHQAYQIDLTQVTPNEATSLSQKEHELEIEVSSEEVRRQAILLQRGEVNQFADLVTGFVDNVRTLARQVPIDHHPV